MSSEELVAVARDLLSYMLRVMQNAARMGRFVADIPLDSKAQSWSHHMDIVTLTSLKLAKYGLPAAGVLALELLQQSQSRRHSSTSLSLSRSEIIQNLSNLIAHLKSLVKKDDGNYAICYQAREVIQRILDQILEPVYTMPDAHHDTDASMSNETTDAAMNQVSWHDTARSELDFWLLLPEHPLFSSVESPNISVQSS